METVAQKIAPAWMHEPITAEQYEAMSPDECRDIEIVDGMVHMSPSALPRHNNLARAIANGLENSGRPEWRTTTDVDLRLRDIPLLNRRPDVVVYRSGTDEDHQLPLDAVLAVVEVVSPGSELVDRREKPAEYADAGIPYYWRVETVGEQPVVHTYALDEATHSYRDTGIFNGVVKTRLAFPVELDLTTV